MMGTLQRRDRLLDDSMLRAVRLDDAMARNTVARMVMRECAGRFDKHAFTRASCLAVTAAMPSALLSEKGYRFEAIRRMKARFGSAFVIDIALECFEVSKAGYYKWLRHQAPWQRKVAIRP